MLDYAALRTLRKASYSMTFQTSSDQFLNLFMLDVILIAIFFVKNVSIQLSAVSSFRLTPKIPI
jgi:hypothetical protein